MSNFNDTTPAPPANSANLKWQWDASGNVSAYFPPATATVLGGVKDGAGVVIAADGTISANVQTTRVVSGPVTPLLTDQMLFVNGSVTLPLSPAVGQTLTIYNYAATAITVSAGAGQTIAGWNGTTFGNLGSITLTGDAAVELTAQTATTWNVTQCNGASSTQGYQAGIAPATAAVAGVVKQGNGIFIAADGTLNYAGGTFSSVSGSVTLAATVTYAHCSGTAPYTVTMPGAPFAGQTITLTNVTTGTITIAANAGQLMTNWNGTSYVYTGTTTTLASGGNVAFFFQSSNSVWYMLTPGLNQSGLAGFQGVVAPATSTVLGAVKQGSGVAIATDGTLTVGLASQWQSWAPTLTPGGTMTVSGVTINKALYLQLGNLWHIYVDLNFTVTANPSTFVQITPPPGYSAPSRQQFSHIASNGNTASGFCLSIVASQATPAFNLYAAYNNLLTFTNAGGIIMAGIFTVSSGL